MTSPPPTHPLDFVKLTRAWRALMAYRALSLQVFDSQAAAFENLPPADQAVIASIPIRLSHAAEAIEHNADVVECVARLTGVNVVFNPSELSEIEVAQTMADFPDVVDGLLAVVRDWSKDGEHDREAVYKGIVEAVEEAAGDAVAARVADGSEGFGVLVVGAGLGRLSWEIARRGFYVQGVESSYLLLFLCNYVLNGEVGGTGGMHLYPYAHHTGMVRDVNDQCAEVEFPDCHVRDVGNGNFSMVAGEFLELYTEEASWDCIVTCFYLENCHSIISVVRRIGHVLRSGGIWINCGGLEFRYEDSDTEPSVEITGEELDLIVSRVGLKVSKRESLKCIPPFSVGGMIQEEVEAFFTVAVKL